MDDIKAQFDLAFEHPHQLTSSVSRSEAMLGSLYGAYRSARDENRRSRLEALRQTKAADEKQLAAMTEQLSTVLAAISEAQAQALELRYEMAHLAVSIDAEQAHIESLEALVEGADGAESSKPSTPVISSTPSLPAAPATPVKAAEPAQAPESPVKA